MLTKEQILQANDLPKELVKVPEWDGEVYVRTMTGAERDAFEQSLIISKGKIDLVNVRAKLCALAICDENGNRLFSDLEIEQLGQKSAVALDRIFEVTQRLNKIGTEDIEELEKNSSSIPSNSSI